MTRADLGGTDLGGTDLGVSRRVLAVDGGGSKTDVVLVDDAGQVLAQVQGPSSQPQNYGVPRALEVLDDLVEQVRRQTGLPAGEPLADHAAVYLSGMDLPEEIAAIEPALRSRGWAPSMVVDNDTFAVLRAGTQARDAVAVVCGSGINCVGRNATGGESRFAALGEISGDWGGGSHLGERALWHAIRADDGRGPATALQAAIAAHFGRPDALSVGIAVHLGEISSRRLVELPPVVFATAAAGDEIAGRLVDRLGSEIALLATVSMRRLELLQKPVDLVLGGGVARSRDTRLFTALSREVHAVNPLTSVIVVDAAPVLGAVLLGLDALGVRVRGVRGLAATRPGTNAGGARDVASLAPLLSSGQPVDQLP